MDEMVVNGLKMPFPEASGPGGPGPQWPASRHD